MVDLQRPPYDPGPQPGTRLRNGRTMREFNLLLADQVAGADDAAQFPLVIGGDCSILLGALAGSRRAGPLSLVHLDGHSDFRHPGNYDPQSMLGAAAGMDLALATGRGEPLMVEWPRVTTPLIPDDQVVQVGERESLDPDFAYPDVNETGFTRIDVFEARRLGAKSVLGVAWNTLDRKSGWRFWLHFDVDVLDQQVMPAVDCPGSPGLDEHDLVEILAGLLVSGRCAGMTVTVFDPDLDPTGEHAGLLVRLIGRAFAVARS